MNRESVIKNNKNINNRKKEKKKKSKSEKKIKFGSAHTIKYKDLFLLHLFLQFPEQSYHYNKTILATVLSLYNNVLCYFYFLCAQQLSLVGKLYHHNVQCNV